MPEVRGTLRPVEDLVLYRAETADWPGGELRDWQVHRREWLRAKDSFQRDVLDLLRREGPLRQREVPDTCAVPWVDQAGEPATVEGTRGEWRVDPVHLGQRFPGRAALLSPFDRLLHDRKRMAQVFDFDYQLEMFKPAAARR